MRNVFARIDTHFRDRPVRTYWILFAIGFLVYLYRLGDLPLFADEPTRSVVALEMIFSGNYWVPTINGEFYYRKTPLYNWILAGLMQLTGHTDEWIVRLPSLVPLFLYGLTIFYWVKKYLAHTTAFLAAAMFVTCGRMLIYASLLGHIDIFYAWVTFSAFAFSIDGWREGNTWKLFVIPYLLHTVGFMCKGLPSVLFAGITAGALPLLGGDWKKMFHPRHFLGLFLFTAIVTGYFYQYSQYNDPIGWWDQLWDQSKQRTVLDKSWYDSFLHLVTFPLDHFMHLAPWMLFMPALFFRGFRKQIRQHRFLWPVVIVFLANIPPYWLSPGYYPRYLFMLYPLFFIVLAHFYLQRREAQPLLRGVETGLNAVVFLLALAPLALFFVELQVDWKWIKALIFSLLILFSGFGMWYSRQYKWLWMVVVLLVVKLGFSWFVISHRLAYGEQSRYTEDAVRIGTKSLGHPLYIFRAYTPVNHNSTHYIEAIRGEILPYSEEFKPGDHVILIDSMTEQLLSHRYTFHKIDTFFVRYERTKLAVVEITGKK